MRRIGIVLGLTLAVSGVSCDPANESTQSPLAAGSDTAQLAAGRMVAVSPQSMFGDPRTAVDPPTVFVADASGVFPISGVPVTFEIKAGGGAAGENTVLTDKKGKASVQLWELGDSAGTNTLVASAPGLAAVVFTATAIGTTGPALRVIAKFDLVSGGGQPASGEHYVLYDNGSCSTVYDAPPAMSATTLPCLYTLSGSLDGHASLMFFYPPDASFGTFFWENGGRFANGESVSGVMTVMYLDTVDFDTEVYQLAK